MNPERIASARELHVAGRLEEALAIYVALLDEKPDDASLWHLRAMAEHQLGRNASARRSAGRAIAIDTGQAAYHLLAGHAATDDGDVEEAVAHYFQAAVRKPDWFAAWISLGSARLEGGDAASACEALERAVALDPMAARAWNELGIAKLALDRSEEARKAFLRALEADSGFVLAQVNLARLSERDGRFDESLKRLEAALRVKPALREALLLRAQLLRRRGDPRASEAHQLAVRALPGDSLLRAAWADFLWESGLPVEAAREFRHAESLDPGNLRAALGARLVLPTVYHDVEHLEASRVGFAQGLEELHAGISRFTRTRPGAALVGASWTNFYLAYQGRNDRELQARYGDFIGKVLRPILPEYFSDRTPQRRTGRPRVGFLSHFFYACTVGRYFASWILELDRARFETVVFHTNSRVDDDTRTIVAAADRFHLLGGLPPLDMARRVAAEELDVLVYPEVGMHAETFALAALRLAPAQVAGWGHPSTTGLANIDVFLTCSEMEPVASRQAYCERVVGLPGIGTRYRRPRTGSTKGREELGLPATGTLFLCPQSLFKIHPHNDELFARVLAGTPRGILVFLGDRDGAVTRQFRQRLLGALSRADVDGERRAVFAGVLPHDEYLRLNEVCDVMLDTLYWSGGNTSLDAIAAGLPLVTLPGELMRGRQSTAMLRRMGLDLLVARDVDDYVNIALRLGSDEAWRRELRATIRERADAVFDDPAPPAAFDQFLAEQAGAGD